jgi:dipeptidyl aminopeptidase/acylaminoacyl peptidase
MDSSSKSAAESAKTRRHGRRFALIGAVMIGLAAALWIGGATLVAYRLKYPPFLEDGHIDVYGKTGQSVTAIDPRAAFGADFERVQIHAGGGRTLEGWMIAGKLPAAVLLVPPVGGTRGTMLPYAKFLHDAGYSVLAIDSGDTAQTGTTWGWSERMGVLAAASELKRRGFKKIGALGVSEGAAQILMVQSAGASFAAIVADSSYGSLAAMFLRTPSIANLNPALQQTIMFEARFLLGFSIWTMEPAKAARELGEAGLLVIHDQDDKIVPLSEAQEISAAAGDRGDLWIVPGDGHGDAIDKEPDQYASRVLKFLQLYLLAPSSDGLKNKI